VLRRSCLRRLARGRPDFGLRPLLAEECHEDRARGVGHQPCEQRSETVRTARSIREIVIAYSFMALDWRACRPRPAPASRTSTGSDRPEPLAREPGLFRSQPAATASVKPKNVVAQLGRCLIEIMRRQLCQKICVGVVRERVFSFRSSCAVIEIAVGQHQLACAYLFQQGAVIVGGFVDALDIQVFRVRGRLLNPIL